MLVFCPRSVGEAIESKIAVGRADDDEPRTVQSRYFRR